MAENMVVPVTGGCPKCGEPNIPVPVDYNDDTIITCPKCGYEAPWAKFFSLDVYGLMNAIPRRFSPSSEHRRIHTRDLYRTRHPDFCIVWCLAMNGLPRRFSTNWTL